MKDNRYKIIFEDKNYLVIDKPAGLLSIPDRYDASVRNLYDDLKRKRSEIYVVHRLDKDTSGLICFANNKQTHALLNKMFEQRSVEKKYLAIVEGSTPAAGKIEFAIDAGKGSGGKMRIAAKGKPSITAYKTIETFRRFSLVEVNLKTGRTHQIRLHFSYIGHPICVDPIYGEGKGIYLSQFKKHYRQKEDRPEQPIMRRLALHAARLSIPAFNDHPGSTHQAELPKDFQVFLKLLRKYDSMPS